MFERALQFQSMAEEVWLLYDPYTCACIDCTCSYKVYMQLRAFNCSVPQTHLPKGSVELHCADLFFPKYLRASECQDGASVVSAHALHWHVSVQLHWVCRGSGEMCRHTKFMLSKENWLYIYIQHIHMQIIEVENRESKEIGSQLGIEPRTFWLLVRCSYPWATGAPEQRSSRQAICRY